MSQYVDNHPLARDFPELKEKIHARKRDDARFARLNDDYEALDKSIVRIEQGLEHLGSDQLETLKVQRVRLKDELYRLLAG